MRNWIIAAILGVVVIGLLIAVRFRSTGRDDGVAVTAPAIETANGEAAPAQPPPIAPPEPVAPSFDVVRVGREGTGVIAGRAAPNADVTVRTGETVIGKAVANRNGEWVLIFDDPIEPGTLEFSLSAVVPGGVSVDSDSVVIVSIPERDFDPAASDESEGVVAVLTPRHGGGASRVLQKPGMVLEESLDRRLLVETIDYDDNGHAVITGKSGAETEVRLYIDNAYLGTVIGDDNGRWVFEPELAVSPGPHTLRLDQIIAVDDVEIRIEQPFDRQNPLDAGQAVGQVVVRSGNNLWRIARRLYGAGYHYTVIYQANQDQIRDPDLIYPGQKFSLPLVEQVN